MSANRYSVCPACQAKHDEKIEAAKVKRDESYGVVSREEYERLDDAYGSLVRKELDTHLREDWEVCPVDDGVMLFTYSCSCSVCDLRRKFEVHQPILQMPDFKITRKELKL